MHDQSANRPWWLSELLFLATIIPAVSRSFSISSQVVLGSWIILFTCLSGICGEHLVIVSLFWNYVLSTSGLWRQQSSLEPSVVQKFFLSLYHQYALQQLWRSWEISSVIHIVIFFLCDTLVMRHIGHQLWPWQIILTCIEWKDCFLITMMFHAFLHLLCFMYSILFSLYHFSLSHIINGHLWFDFFVCCWHLVIISCQQHQIEIYLLRKLVMC